MLSCALALFDGIEISVQEFPKGAVFGTEIIVIRKHNEIVLQLYIIILVVNLEVELRFKNVSQCDKFYAVIPKTMFLQFLACRNC